MLTSKVSGIGLVVKLIKSNILLWLNIYKRSPLTPETLILCSHLSKGKNAYLCGREISFLLSILRQKFCTEKNMRMRKPNSRTSKIRTTPVRWKKQGKVVRDWKRLHQSSFYRKFPFVSHPSNASLWCIQRARELII
ncbi:hypothetical protein VTL71DRAFT_1796 [Oculimacula yallundae]|uniref:Uncharacterized protein n=1 Tax=Oculimacula yallundae TaxID=86028 RepID=A0ABR4CD29_9HELO